MRSKTISGHFTTRRDDPGAVLSRTKSKPAIQPSNRVDASPPLTCHSFSVRPEARFSVSTRGRSRQPRAGAVKAGRLGGHPQGSALTAPNTAAGFERSGLKSLGPRQIERFRGPVAGHDIALRYAHDRRNRGLAAGGVTRMGRDAGRRLGRAARFGPRDSTRSRPLAAASRPSLYLSSRPHGRSATHAYRSAPFLTELGLTPIQVAEIFH
jgi:hypothetical protein